MAAAIASIASAQTASQAHIPRFSEAVAGGPLPGGWAPLSFAYERDLVADYRAAFGEAPPRISGVAIMTDSDNTGGRATASYGDITLGAR